MNFIKDNSLKTKKDLILIFNNFPRFLMTFNNKILTNHSIINLR